MSSSQPSQVTQVSKTELPGWVNNAAQNNYNLAQQIASKPLSQYQGPTVAGTTPDTQFAYDLFRSTMGTGQSNIDAASAGYKGVLGQQLPDVTAQSVDTNNKVADVTSKNFTDYNINDYMNPYIDDVVKKAMDQLRLTNQQTLQSNAAKAISSGAFGGARSGVVDAVTNANTARDAGVLSSQLYSDAFDKAAGLITGDANRSLAAATSNQGKDVSIAGLNQQGQIANQNSDLAAQNANLQALLAKLGLDSNASSGLLSAADAEQKARMNNFSGLSAIGAAEQAQNQAEINADVAKFNEARDYDLNNLNILLSSLGMSPYGQSTSTSNTTVGGSSGTDYAQVGMGILSMLPALVAMSDRDEKTDIKPLGKDKATGIPLYAYRYKGDPKTYPKVVGPMAQDLEKMYPGSTAKMAGRRVVPGLMAAYR